MCPDHSDHPALPQVIAVSCDNSEVSADTREADPDRKNAVFQADWLSNRTHHTDNPISVPTQNRAQNCNEPAWVKQMETMLAGKMYLSKDVTEFMTTKSWTGGISKVNAKNSHSNLLVEYDTTTLIHPATGASLSSKIIMFIIPFISERLTLGF